MRRSQANNNPVIRRGPGAQKLLMPPPTLDPHVAEFFRSTYHLPREFGERQDHPGIDPAAFAAAPLSEWHITSGHPTEALINYFKTRYTTRRRILVHYAPEATSDVQRRRFREVLATVLLRPMEECAALPFRSTENAWIPPCRHRRGCGRLCRALLARLATLETAARIAEWNGAAKVGKIAYAHIDAHMRLLCMLAQSSLDLIDDTNDVLDLRQPLCSDHNLAVLLAAAPPTIDDAFIEEKMPDLSSLIPLGVIYNNTPTSNKRFAQIKFPGVSPGDLTVILLLMNLLFKTLPHRCNNRDFYDVFKRNIHADPNLQTLMLKIILASLLGIYSKSSATMPTNLRVGMYRFFYRQVPQHQLVGTLDENDKPNHDGVLCPGNTVTLLYMGKEYCRYLVEQNPGMLKALTEIFNWPAYDSFLTTIITKVRTLAWENMSSTVAPIRTFRDIFRGIDPQVQPIHEKYRVTQRQNNVNYNIYTIVAALHDINYLRYSTDGDIILAGKEHLLPDPAPHIPDDHYQLMKEIIATYPKDSHVAMDWLFAFGVTFDQIRCMKIAVFAKGPDLYRALTSLPEGAYAIFFNFFRAYLEHLEYQTYPCDTRMYYAHMRAVHECHGVPPGGRIPIVAGTIQMCPNCGQLMGPSFSDTRRKARTNKNSGAIACTGDGVTVCAKTRKAPEWREVDRQKAEMENMTTDQSVTALRLLDQTDKTVSRKQAKGIAQQHILSRCRSTPTKTLCVLGQVVMFSRCTFVGCFSCVSWLRLEDAVFVGADILCQPCAARCCPPVKFTAQCHVATCNKRIRTREELVTVWVYDDDEDKQGANACFRFMNFCAYHGNFRWIRTGDDNRTVLRVSEINARIAAVANERRGHR